MSTDSAATDRPQRGPARERHDLAVAQDVVEPLGRQLIGGRRVPVRPEDRDPHVCEAEPLGESLLEVRVTVVLVLDAECRYLDGRDDGSRPTPAADPPVRQVAPIAEALAVRP